MSISIGVAEATPLGDVWVGLSEAGLVAVEIQADPDRFAARLARRFSSPVVPDQEHAAAYTAQIQAYLSGRRTAFDLAIDWSSLTSFQRQALQEVGQIPYGQTATYGEIAVRIGKPGAARAVGRANAANPMPLVVPCHRVVGRDGNLRGYGAPGGLETKAWLLALESSENSINDLFPS